MHRFVQGDDRTQASFLPASLEDYIDADNLARVIDAFVEALDLGAFGFAVVPAATGRPGYHPTILLKLYIYGYLNRIQSSRRLERECGRNVELMWLTRRLAPDFKTIADFRCDNGESISTACAQFIVICRELGLSTRPLAAIDEQPPLLNLCGHIHFAWSSFGVLGRTRVHNLGPGINCFEI